MALLIDYSRSLNPALRRPMPTAGAGKRKRRNAAPIIQDNEPRSPVAPGEAVNPIVYGVDAIFVLYKSSRLASTYLTPGGGAAPHPPNPGAPIQPSPGAGPRRYPPRRGPAAPAPGHLSLLTRRRMSTTVHDCGTFAGAGLSGARIQRLFVIRIKALQPPRRGLCASVSDGLSPNT